MTSLLRDQICLISGSSDVKARNYLLSNENDNLKKAVLTTQEENLNLKKMVDYIKAVASATAG